MSGDANRRGWNGFIGIMLLGLLCILAAWQAERLGISAFIGWPAATALWVYGAKSMVAAI